MVVPFLAVILLILMTWQYGAREHRGGCVSVTAVLRPLAGLLAIAIVSLLPTAVVPAYAHVYDFAAAERVHVVSADASPTQLSDVRGPSAAPFDSARGTSTTLVSPGVATNTVDDAMAGVRAAGARGEAAAGIVKNTQRIPSLSGSAPYRIPDGLGNGVLSEVKNVSSLSYTSQLRDFAAYAQQEGLAFNLYVRGSTTLSGPLQAAVDNGTIALIRSLPG